MRAIQQLESAAARVWRSKQDIKDKACSFELVRQGAQRYLSSLSDWRVEHANDPWVARLTDRNAKYVAQLIEDLDWMIEECRECGSPLVQVASSLASATAGVPGGPV